MCGGSTCSSANGRSRRVSAGSSRPVHRWAWLLVRPRPCAIIRSRSREPTGRHLALLRPLVHSAIYTRRSGQDAVADAGVRVFRGPDRALCRGQHQHRHALRPVRHRRLRRYPRLPRRRRRDDQHLPPAGSRPAPAQLGPAAAVRVALRPRIAGGDDRRSRRPQRADDRRLHPPIHLQARRCN